MKKLKLKLFVLTITSIYFACTAIPFEQTLPDCYVENDEGIEENICNAFSISIDTIATKLPVVMNNVTAYDIGSNNFIILSSNNPIYLFTNSTKSITPFNSEYHIPLNYASCQLTNGNVVFTDSISTADSLSSCKSYLREIDINGNINGLGVELEFPRQKHLIKEVADNIVAVIGGTDLQNPFDTIYQVELINLVTEEVTLFDSLPNGRMFSKAITSIDINYTNDINLRNVTLFGGTRSDSAILNYEYFQTRSIFTDDVPFSPNLQKFSFNNLNEQGIFIAGGVENNNSSPVIFNYNMESESMSKITANLTEVKYNMASEVITDSKGRQYIIYVGGMGNNGQLTKAIEYLDITKTEINSLCSGIDCLKKARSGHALLKVTENINNVDVTKLIVIGGSNSSKVIEEIKVDFP